MYTNFYVFRYAAILVIIVAALLSAAAVLLKPRQDRNIAVAKMEGILTSASIQASSSDAEKLYDKYIVEEQVINMNGDVVESQENPNFSEGNMPAFKINLKKELYKKSIGEDLRLPLYKAEIDGEVFYIIPLLGKGLWGPVYGNIAFGEDLNTVVGATFGHAQETPGLGAEITEPFFEDQFIGKTIFDENGKFTSIKVVKGGALTLPPNMQIHGVDAISGGTITSNSVSDMIYDNLENYVEFIKKQK